MMLEYNFSSRILYIEKPTEFRTIFDKKFSSVYKLKKQLILKNHFNELYKINDNFFVLKYFRSTKPNFLKQFLDKANRNFLLEAVKMLNFIKPTFWSYSPLSADFLEDVDFGMKIFDAADNWMPHVENCSSAYKVLIFNSYKKICFNMDKIFCASEDTANFFKKLGGKSFTVNNGVDSVLFEDSQNVVPVDIASVSKPILGYIGSCFNQGWLRADIDLIRKISEFYPTFSFVFIGPYDKKIIKPFAFSNNVYFLGIKKKDEIKSYLKHFDIAMLPHSVSDLTDGMDPLKLYEYMAVGLPIVSTSVSGVKKFKDLIYVAQNPEEFIKFIEIALAESSLLREKRIAMASQFTWEEVFRKMLDIIYGI